MWCSWRCACYHRHRLSTVSPQHRWWWKLRVLRTRAQPPWWPQQIWFLDALVGRRMASKRFPCRSCKGWKWVLVGWKIQPLLEVNQRATDCVAKQNHERNKIINDHSVQKSSHSFIFDVKFHVKSTTVFQISHCLSLFWHRSFLSLGLWMTDEGRPGCSSVFFYPDCTASRYGMVMWCMV